MTEQPRIKSPSRYALEKMCYEQRKEITRLRASVAELEAKQLKPGEYVCRDVTCKMCLGKKKYYNQYADREFKCNICNGTGLVPERVGQE